MTALLAHDLTSPAAFLAFLETRPDHERWELIDGEAVMQASASLRHQMIVLNIAGLINSALEAQNSPWFALPGGMVDLTAATPGNMYIPDVLVLDTTRVALDQNTTPDCIVAFEILSPSDRKRIGRGQARKIEVKLDRYRELPSCRAVILVEQDAPSLTLYSRAEGSWLEQPVRGLDAELSVPLLGLRCRLHDIYRRTSVAEAAP